MRWILLCLITFNVLYFGWEQYTKAFQPKAAVALPAVQTPLSSGERLILLKETRPAPGSAAPPPTIGFESEPTQEIETVPVVVTEAGHDAIQAVLGEPESQSSSEPVDADEFPASIQQEIQVSEADVLVNAPVDSEVVAAEIVEAEIVDMADQALPAASLDSAAVSVVDAEEASAKLTKVCAKLGPFADKGYAQSLLENLAAEEIVPRLREEEVLLNSDSWVVIPPLGSRKDALKMLRRLQSNKIDSYLITEGEYANGISLGLFKRSASAQGVLEKMLAAGYDVEIQKIDRTKAQFWVGFSGDFEVQKVQAMVAQLVEDSGKIKFSETLCEMFASAP